MSDKWISVTEAAQLAGYTNDHIRRLIKHEQITARKVITVWQVERNTLLSYLRKTEKLGKRRGPKAAD